MSDTVRTKQVLQVLPIAQCVNLLRLLHAVDCFPRGGLYEGYYAVAAAVRYEEYWIKVLTKHMTTYLPPLDVAFAWFVHRQDPVHYRRSLNEKGCQSLHPNAAKAFSFGPNPVDYAGWRGATGSDQPVWPPPAPGSKGDVLAQPKAQPPTFAFQVAARMSRFSRLLHSWLRPHFLDVVFLDRAKLRYGRFLALHAEHPDAALVPTADIALVWHTHLGLSWEYADACRQLYGTAAEPWRPDYLDLAPDKLAGCYNETARLYQDKYGEPYDGPDTAWLDASVQYPLAALGSPLAFALRVFDENPQRQQQEEALATASMQVGVPFPAAGSTVSRSGAHGLFAAWLASRRAETAFDALTCNSCYGTSSAKVHMKTLRHMAASLVSVAYFLDLPDCHTHPYLQAVSLRKGLWHGHECPTGAEDGSKPSMSTPPPAAPAGFDPSDPCVYLNGREAELLNGLAPLLAPGPAQQCRARALLIAPCSRQQRPPAHKADQSPSPLWSILAKKGMPEVAQSAFSKAWAAGSRDGVGRMQRCYLSRRNRSYGNRLYGTNDYYFAPQLYVIGYGYEAAGSTGGEDGSGGGVGKAVAEHFGDGGNGGGFWGFITDGVGGGGGGCGGGGGGCGGGGG